MQDNSEAGVADCQTSGKQQVADTFNEGQYETGGATPLCRQESQNSASHIEKLALKLREEHGDTGVASGHTSGQKHAHNVDKEWQKEAGGKTPYRERESQLSATQGEKIALKLREEHGETSVAAGHSSGQNHAHNAYKEWQKEAGGETPYCERDSQNSASDSEKLALKLKEEHDETSVAAGHASGQNHAHNAYKEWQKEAGGETPYCERESQNSASDNEQLALKLREEQDERSVAAGHTSGQSHAHNAYKDWQKEAGGETPYCKRESQNSASDNEQLALKVREEHEETSVAAGHTSGQHHAHNAYKEWQKEAGGETPYCERESQNSASHSEKNAFEVREEKHEDGTAGAQTSLQQHAQDACKGFKATPCTKHHHVPRHMRKCCSRPEPPEMACGAMAHSETPRTKIGGNDSTQQTNDLHTYNTLAKEAEGQHENCARKKGSNGEKGGKPVNGNYWASSSQSKSFCEGKLTVSESLSRFQYFWKWLLEIPINTHNSTRHMQTGPPVIRNNVLHWIVIIIVLSCLCFLPNPLHHTTHGVSKNAHIHSKPHAAHINHSELSCGSSIYFIVIMTLIVISMCKRARSRRTTMLTKLRKTINKKVTRRRHHMRHTKRQQTTSTPTSVEPQNPVPKSHPKQHTRHTPSLRAFTSRGGGQQPGKPTHHRFWIYRNSGLSHAEDNMLCLTASHLRIHRLYNPPGDGMCFWHSIVNGLQPGLRTHYDRMHAAVCTQRRVIQFVREQSRQPDKLNHYISLLRDSSPAGTTISHTTLETQLAEL